MFEFIVVMCLLYICWQVGDPQRDSKKPASYKENRNNPYRSRRH